MGGNALKQVGVTPKRVNSQVYHKLMVPLAKRYLKAAFKDLLYPQRFHVVQSYRNKPSFGDMDILIASDNLPSDWKSRIQNAFKSKASASNGSVLSTEMHGMQVDLIPTPLEHFDFALNYFAWNDLGNLIGRVARACGFKFGHDGLWYTLRDPSNQVRVIKECLVTRDFHGALDFLEFDSKRFKEGFDDLEDIFRFVYSCPNTYASSFDLEKRSRKARVRDKKRPNYVAFLKWMHDHSYDRTVDTESLPDKNAFLYDAFIWFPDFERDYQLALDEFVTDEEFKSYFNGEIVRELTGIEGPKLGELMARIVSNNGGKYEFKDKLLSQNDKQSYVINEIHKALAYPLSIL